eukprot:6123700-Amphidinium_carterae.1
MCIRDRLWSSRHRGAPSRGMTHNCTRDDVRGFQSGLFPGHVLELMPGSAICLRLWEPIRSATCSLNQRDVAAKALEAVAAVVFHKQARWQDPVGERQSPQGPACESAEC